MPADLHQLAASVVVYDEAADPRRVIIAYSGVGVTRGLRVADAGAAAEALRKSLGFRIWSAGVLEVVPASRLAESLVQHRDDGAGRFTILVCGSELVGQEEPAAAESRARSMRAVLITEIERALADQMPATVRRSPPSTVEAR